MMKVLVTCALKFHSDHLIYQLQKRGLLYRAITSYPASLYCNRETLDKERIIFFTPLFIFFWSLSKISGRLYFLKSLSNWFMSAIFDWLASLFVGSADLSISWAWSSYYIIKKIKRQGGIAIIEKCSSFNKYQEKILREEYERLGLNYRSNTHKRILEREQRECETADYILCPSRYVANSLIEYGIKKEKILIIPYGVSLDLFRKEEKKDDFFRVIFVGTVGVRKGIIYLFQALEKLNLSNFECLIIGSVEPCFKPFFEQYKKYFKYIPKVKHGFLRYYYSDASVFVLPSIDDAWGLVVTEVMASGLPVICTTNTGVHEIVRDHIDGFIIPIRDSDSIREKIEYLYNNPLELERMGDNALKRIKEYTWDNYGDKLVSELEKIMKKDV